RHKDAEAYLLQALVAFRDDRNQQSEASALCNLSRVHLDTGRVDSAISLAEEGIAIYRRLGARRRLANGMYALALAYTQAEQLTAALGIFQDSRQRFWEGMTNFRLAEVDLAAGRPTAAANRAEQALTALRGIGGESWRASALTTLGRALNEIGHTGRARVC